MPFRRECSNTQARWSDASTALRRWRIRELGILPPPPVSLMDMRDWRREVLPLPLATSAIDCLRARASAWWAESADSGLVAWLDE